MPITAFLCEQIIATGCREDVTRQIEDYYPFDTGTIMAFDDATGRAIDLQYWRAAEDVDIFTVPLSCEVVDLKLLACHWQWLNGQPRGAAAAIRRLVEAAMIEPISTESQVGPAHHFMVAMCGNWQNYERALQALHRHELQRFRQLIADWPADIAAYLARLIEAEPASPSARVSAR